MKRVPLVAFAAVILGSVAVVAALQAQPPRDPAHEAQTTRSAPANRPEQQKSRHDTSDAFQPNAAPPNSPTVDTQPEKGRAEGFDFARDPLNAKKPMQTFDEIMKQDMADRPKVAAAQRKLLEARYELAPRTDRNVTMSRGKPVPIGPTAKLPRGTTWDALAAMKPEDIRS